MSTTATTASAALMIYGIPGFKLEKEIVLRRHKLLEAGGIKFHLGQGVGEGLDFEDLRSRHDAILIATGVYKPREIGGPGAGLGGVVRALDFLTASNRQGLGDSVPEFDNGALNASGKRVVVIGGGDTAMDCVRTAVRQGAVSVKCLYRRDQANMPGSMREVKNAQEEGVEFVWLSAPEAFLGDGTVSGVRVAKMRLGMPDASGRASVEKSDERVTLDARPRHQGAGVRSGGPARPVGRAGPGRQPVGHAQDGPSHGHDVSAGRVRGGRHRARRQPGRLGNQGRARCRAAQMHGVHRKTGARRRGRVIRLKIRPGLNPSGNARPPCFDTSNQDRGSPWTSLPSGPRTPPASWTPIARRTSMPNCGVGMVAALDGKPRRDVVQAGIDALKAVWHRGAVDADGKTGDGAGIHIEIPQDFFAEAIQRGGDALPAGRIAVGQVFLPKTDLSAQETCRSIVETAILSFGHGIHGWRQVPIDVAHIGEKANATRPEIEQIMIRNGTGADEAAFERDLYVIRRRIEKQAIASQINELYICSLSCRSIIYKGMFLAENLTDFYPDLLDPRFVSRFAIYHQRYSTNTFPTWRLAQPFRMLAHNGEINTISGNTNWMKSHETRLADPAIDAYIDDIKPVIQAGSSDTAALDSVFELLVRAGRDAPMVKAMLIPASISVDATMKQSHKDMFLYCNAIMEPWDGPGRGCRHRWPLDARRARPQRPAPAPATRSHTPICWWSGPRPAW